MKKPLGSRGAAAAASSILALLVAGGGYAIASGTGGAIKACVHKHGGGLYTGRCARHDRKLSWNAVGPPGPRGAQGAQGVPGAPGSALAYAHVIWNSGTSTASFDPNQTAGMGSATVTQRGIAAFCFGNLPFTAHNATATVDFPLSPSGSDIAQVEIQPPGGSTSTCSPGENVQVETINAHTNTGQLASFYVTFN
jgi:hypothetical protein